MDPASYPSNPVTGGPVVAESETTYREELYAPPVPAPTWTDRIEFTRWAFYLGLAGGVLVLVAAFVAALFMAALDAMDIAIADDWTTGALLIGVWGLVTGGAILLAALRTKERPAQAALPGLVMVAAGVLSFFALGGFILGGLLAIVAGVLAVAGSRTLWTMRAPRVRRDAA